MSELHDQIRNAQILAGEQVVVDNLRSNGLTLDDPVTIEVQPNKELRYANQKIEYYKKALTAILNTSGFSDRAEVMTMRFIAKDALKEYP